MLPIVVRTVFSMLLAIPSGRFTQASDRPCLPVGERTTQAAPACRTAVEELGQLPSAPMFWHLDRFATRAAAEVAKGVRGTVVESLDVIWLFTIAEKGWRPASGERVAEIGPLPVDAHTSYTAVYMQAVSNPGTTALVHRHSGPEAFYGLTGGVCIETPEGRAVGEGDGHSVVVRGGVPMSLMAIGTTERRGLTLILHDSSEPPTTMVHDGEWVPRGLCKP